MNLQFSRSRFPRRALHGVIAILSVASLPWSSFLVQAQEAPQAESQEMATTEEAPKIPNDQLDSLVAPIALYPDAMLAQTLAASTYPLEVMQLDQWMDKNKNLKDKALADAVAKAAVGPERAVDGRISRRGTADGGEYSVDDRRGKCGFGAAKGCDGRRATNARKGAGHRESQDRFGTESGDQDNPKRSAGDCSRTS